MAWFLFSSELLSPDKFSEYGTLTLVRTSTFAEPYQWSILSTVWTNSIERLDKFMEGIEMALTESENAYFNHIYKLDFTSDVEEITLRLKGIRDPFFMEDQIPNDNITRVWIITDNDLYHIHNKWLSLWIRLGIIHKYHYFLGKQSRLNINRNYADMMNTLFNLESRFGNQLSKTLHSVKSKSIQL